MKEIASIFGIIVLITGLIVGAIFGSFELYQYFAPKYEAVRRDTMIESRAYSEGTLRELYRLKLQYETAEPAGRATIAAAARHQFSIFPTERLPADLQGFMIQVSR